MKVDIQVIPLGNIWDAKTIEKDLAAVADRVVDDAQALYNRVTATWNHRVTWEKKKGIRGNDYVAELKTDDGPLFWLDGGTTVRHAVMSRDFIPKTAPRRFYSRRGRGKRVFVSRKINRPGIKERGWTIEIIKIMSKVLYDEVDIVMMEVADARG